MKQYRSRARKFMGRATTVEGKMAWIEVISWFDDILKNKKITEKGVIVLPPVKVQELEEDVELDAPV